MLALGLLSIVEIALLPGLIGVLALRLADGLLRTLALSFGLSILFNYVLVLVLSLLHIAAPVSFYIIAAAELVVLGLVLARRGIGPLLADDIGRLRSLLARVAAEPPARRILGSFVLVAGMCAWSLTIAGAIDAAGRVFSGWDAVVSWNKWAAEWFTLGYPRDTWTYPQLLPALFSVTYQFIRTPDVQFFAMALTGLFPLAMLAAMTDLALRRGELRYIAALVGTWQVLGTLLGPDSMSGFADEPVAAVIFLSVYCLLSAEGEPVRAQRLAIAGALCAAAAAATKQQGLFLGAAYPVLSWIVLLRDADLRPSRRVAIALTAATIVALGVGPWYLYCQLIHNQWGYDYMTTGIHAGRGMTERLTFAMKQASMSWGPPAWVLGIIGFGALVASMLHRVWRWVTVLVTVPLLVLWLLVVGYTARNTAAAIPLMVTGGLVGLAGPLTRVRPGQARPAIAYGLLTLAALAAVSTLGLTRWRASRLMAMSRDARTGAFNPEINRLLYRYAADPGFGGKILTNYQVLGFIPDLAPLYRFNPLTDEKVLETALADREITHVFYFTYRGLSEPLKRRVDAGRLKTAASGPLYFLFNVDRSAP